MQPWREKVFEAITEDTCPHRWSGIRQAEDGRLYKLCQMCRKIDFDFEE